MNLVNIKINGIDISVPEGTTILQAAKKLNVRIPTLCNMELDAFSIVSRSSSCRVCMVEAKGRPNLVPACSEKVYEGLEVMTDTLKAINARRMAVELLLSNHPKDCLMCPKNLDCELQSLAAELGIREIRYQGEVGTYEIDNTSYSIIKNPNKCVMCRRCETMCNEVQTCNILSGINRGFGVFVGPAFNMPMSESSCTFCGQCVAVCPTAALTEVNHTRKVWQALSRKDIHTVVQVAPAIRVAIGEEFGLEPGTITTGQIAAALRKLGFDGVFDTNFGADLTIMEEASELVHRIQNNGRLPILTSCCPAWVKFFEHQFPDLLDIPSSCKSPMIMFGTIAKSYYAEKHNIDPEKMKVIAVMPCIAKKAEANRPELTKDHNNNVDIVITTREFATMLREAGIDFAKLEPEEFDTMLGESTGAGAIFGTTGGVIEAATRTAYEWITGEDLEEVEFTDLRGLEGIRSATVPIGDLNLKIGIAHGFGNARKLLEDIREGRSEFHAIEIMACPGGCVGGGGQPYHHGNMEIIKKRQAALYVEDREKKIRKSHENPEIIKLYDEYLDGPFSEKAHELLHTHYKPKEMI